MKATFRQVFTSGISYFVLTLVLLSSCGREGHLTLNLSGDDWTVVPADSGAGEKNRYYSDNYPFTEDIPARVPGDIHWDLERANVIPDLYLGKNTLDARWVTSKEWWYRKVFKAEKNWAGKKVRLHFEAVDYLADVWLNSQYLGQHEGQFTPFEFEVTEMLQFGQDNILTVKIHPVPEKVRRKISEERGEWEVMHAMRPSYPYWKSMTSSGWDWGADLISMGIWQNVSLIATEDLYASNLTVLPQLSPLYDKATLSIKLNLFAYEDKRVRLTYQTRCLTSEDKQVILEKEEVLLTGMNDIKARLEIQNPQLWWPNGYGRQHLYELSVKVSYVDNDTPLDQLSATYGIRDLKMLSNPKSPNMNLYKDYNPDYEPGRVLEITDSIPQPAYLIQINGRRIMGMGANWLPCDLLFGRPEKEFYENLIRLAAEANFNLFRIWGGGIIEKQIFFDLCDKYGIMLFAEFPNGGPRLSESEEALKISALETRQILHLMMNHPSIVRYGGGNEWYLNAGNSRQMSQLRQICNKVDSTRPFHDPDPETISQRHGPHEYTYGQHYQIYNTGYPLTAGPDDPFEWTEYGASGASSVETLRHILPEESLWPVEPSDPYWQWHKGYNAYGPDNWLRPSQYTLLFGQLPDLETTVRCSQFTQAEGLRYANQSMRRNQWHRSAFTSWTYNEPWPNAAHGCLVEYYGNPKMAYYYARKSCAAVDVSCVYDNLECSQEKPLDLEVWISSNNTNEMHDHTLRWRIFNTHGQNLYEGEKNVTVSPEQSEMTGKIHWRPSSGMEGDVALLYLELLDSNEKVIAENMYTFGIRKTGPDISDEATSIQPLKALLHASPTELKISSVSFKKNGTGNIEGIVEIENVGENAGLFVELDFEVLGDIKAYFSDKYFFLPVNQKRKISANLLSEKAGPIPDQVKLSLEAWNSPVQTLEVHIK